jgi:hypothetical protein
MKNVHALFAAFGGTSAVARILNVGTSTASEMKRRGSVPVEHWPALIAAAPAAKIKGVTPEALMAMHAAVRVKPRQSEGARV